MFGREARFTIHVLLVGDEDIDENTIDWLTAHQTRLRDAYQRAGEHLKHQAQKPREHHSAIEYDIPIHIGQLVYLQNQVRGRKRVQDTWDSTPHSIVADYLGSVYTIARKVEPSWAGPLLMRSTISY